MATKKKKKSPPKKAPRKAAPRRRKPFPIASAAAASTAVKPAPRRNGLLLAILILGLLLAVIWRGQRQFALPESQTPEGRSPATAAPRDTDSSQAPSPRPTLRRETAGETGEPSLTFDRAEQESLSVRCWRPAEGQAQLDVFGPRNQRVRTLTSGTGPAGWQNLRWDGKDEQGRKVPAGLYFVRPSARDLQQVRDVWVKG